MANLDDRKITELKQIIIELGVKSQATTNEVSKLNNGLSRELHLMTNHTKEIEKTLTKFKDFKKLNNSTFDTEMYQTPLNPSNNETKNISSILSELSNNFSDYIKKRESDEGEKTDLIDMMDTSRKTIESEINNDGVLNKFGALMGSAKDKINNNLTKITKGLNVTISKSSIKELISNIKPVINENKSSKLASLDPIKKTKESLSSKAGNIKAKASDNIMEAVAGGISKIGAAIAKLVSAWGNVPLVMIMLGVALAIPLGVHAAIIIGGLYFIIKFLIKTFMPLITKIVDTVSELLPQIIETIGKTISLITPWGTAFLMIRTVMEKIPSLFNKISEMFSNLWGGLKGVVKDMWTVTSDAIRNGVESFKTMISNIWEKIKGFIKGSATIKNGLEMTKQAGSTIWNTAKNFLGPNSVKPNDIVDNNGPFNALTKPITDSIDAFSNLVKTYLEKIAAGVTIKPISGRSENAMETNNLKNANINYRYNYATPTDGALSQDFNRATSYNYGGNNQTGNPEEFKKLTERVEKLTEVAKSILSKIPDNTGGIGGGLMSWLS